MTPNHLISIIIPVYNAEKYLEACLDSISKQSHENIQIILVNDGSSDRSSEICNNYESRDSRATVIHQTNKGASSARNTGLSAARGEYVTFIDSDDTVHNDYIKLLMSQMSDSLDVTSCQMTPSLAGLSPSFERSLTMSGQDAVASLLYGKGIITGPLR